MNLLQELQTRNAEYKKDNADRVYAAVNCKITTHVPGIVKLYYDAEGKRIESEEGSSSVKVKDKIVGVVLDDNGNVIPGSEVEGFLFADQIKPSVGSPVDCVGVAQLATFQYPEGSERAGETGIGITQLNLTRLSQVEALNRVQSGTVVNI